MASVGTVRLRLFARLADIAGTRATEVELGEGLTAADAYRLLCQEHPGMAGLEASLMYAVNAEYVPPEHPLRDGDELALIPPVSGGALDSVILSRRLPPGRLTRRRMFSAMAGSQERRIRRWGLPRAPANTGTGNMEHGNGERCCLR